MESAFPSAQWLPPDFSPELKSEVGRIQFPDRMAYECAALFQSYLPAFNFEYLSFSINDNQHIVYIYMCRWRGDSLSVKMISATPLNHKQGSIFFVLYCMIWLLTLMFSGQMSGFEKADSCQAIASSEIA